MSDWRQEHANEAEKALRHHLVQYVMEEFANNMGFKLDGLPKYGLMKVASYAAQVARAQALGIDPEDLRSTPEEHDRQMLDLVALFQEQCKPVVIVRPEEGEAGNE